MYLYDAVVEWQIHKLFEILKTYSGMFIYYYVK